MSEPFKLPNTDNYTKNRNDLEIPAIIPLKIVLCGNESVGKSSLIARYVDDLYEDAAHKSIGIEFKLKILKWKKLNLKLQIWDYQANTRYQRFHRILPAYFRHASLIVYCADVMDRSSFQDLSQWKSHTQSTANGFDWKEVVVGTKCDVLEQNRVVSKEEAKQFAQNLQVEHYFETSAKQAFGLEELFPIFFDSMIDSYLTHYNEVTLKGTNELLLLPNNPPRPVCNSPPCNVM